MGLCVGCVNRVLPGNYITSVIMSSNQPIKYHFQKTIKRGSDGDLDDALKVLRSIVAWRTKHKVRKRKKEPFVR